MGANKIGSYIAQRRTKKKEAAEEEKRRRLEDVKRRPEIIDPSFEILGYGSPTSDDYGDGSFSHTLNTTISPSSTNDDWTFQTRTATDLPGHLQFEPYCEVTPKSSVSSNNSAASDARPQHEYDMGWDSSNIMRPRPQSYLPTTHSASYSYSMTDLSRGSASQSKKQTAPNTRHQRQESMPSYSKRSAGLPTYRLESTLSRPFSVDDPLDSLTEPLRDSHLYHRSRDLPIYDEPEDDRDLPSPPYDGTNVPEYRDDLVKRGYRV